jgi:hypothetical protein
MIWQIFALVNVSAFTIPIIVRLAFLAGDLLDLAIEKLQKRWHS